MYRRRKEKFPHLQSLHRDALEIGRTPADHLAYERRMRLLGSHCQHPGVLLPPLQDVQEEDLRLQLLC